MANRHEFTVEPYRTLADGIGDHDFDLVNQTLNANPTLDLNRLDDSKTHMFNILSYCVLDGTHSILRLLLEHGMDPNPTYAHENPRLITQRAGQMFRSVPLILCMIQTPENENLLMFQVLLEFGADTERTRLDRLTPLALALARNEPTFAEMLIDAGAKVDWGSMERSIKRATRNGDVITQTTEIQRYLILRNIIQTMLSERRYAFARGTLQRDGREVAPMGVLPQALVQRIALEADDPIARLRIPRLPYLPYDETTYR